MTDSTQDHGKISKQCSYYNMEEITPARFA